METFDKNSIPSDEKPTGKKKMLLFGIFGCLILIVFLTVLIIVFKQVDATTFKLYVDQKRSASSSDFTLTDNSGNVYVKAKELAPLIGWTYENGEYGSYTEDTNSGYMQNQYEAASFTVNSTTLKKYIISSETNSTETQTNTDESEEATIQIAVNSEPGTLETMELSLPVLSSNNQLYIPLSEINDICDCSFSYENQYRMYIYSLDYLTDLALQNAGSFGYTSVSGTYENLRALAYGMLVVKDNSGKYGVVSLYSNSSILGFKYSEMVFNQNVKEFLVKTSDDTVGIVAEDGTVIISPKNYDNISVLSDKLGLYLIEKDSQYGVMNREGNTIVYPEYDSIGLSDEVQHVFESDLDDEKYVLYNNTIVVEKDDKYGFYNLEGSNTLTVNFQGIGYITDSDEEAYKNSKDSSNSSNVSSNSNDSNSSSTSSSDGNSTLMMDLEIELDDGETGEVKAIVVKQTGLDGLEAYGLYDAIQQKLVIPCGCTRIYSKTKSGVTTYYLEYMGEQYELKEFLKEQGTYTLTSEMTNN